MISRGCLSGLFLGALSLATIEATTAHAEPSHFEGRIEAAHEAVLSTRLDGVVAEVLFNGGDEVTEGQALIRLDAEDARLALIMAEADLAVAGAELDAAKREAARQETLAARGLSPDAVLVPAVTARAAAAANLKRAQAVHTRATLDLERTTIKAPITGLISRSNVVVGQYLEAEAGPPLATIVALDRVLVGYDTPYGERLQALQRTGSATVDELLARVRVELLLPGGQVYPLTATPHTASPTVDAETGAVRVWAVIENPDRLLRPGMAVTVRSTIGQLSQ